MDLIRGLNRRFDFATNCKSEREFYEYVYHYFDYIHKTPALLGIFESAQREYSRKHGEIWEKPRYETEEELEVRAQATYKMEHFDMFAIASGMYVRIYWKIDNYRNTSEPDAYQDSMAVALIKGPEYAAKVCSTRYPERGGSYKKQILKQYKNWYENKREFYGRELRDFHFLLLNAVEAVTPKNDEVDPDFKFDITTGDFTYGKATGTLTPKTQEYVVFKYLYENLSASYLDIIHQYDKGIEPPLKAYKSDLYIIIRNIKQKFGILPNGKDANPDFIVNVRDFGYRLVFKRESSE